MHDEDTRSVLRADNPLEERCRGEPNVTIVSTPLNTTLAPHQVPKNWEDYLPEHLESIKSLEEATEFIGQQLAANFRMYDEEADLTGFLTHAYEPRYYFWESLECVRRLALTGGLTMFGEPFYYGHEQVRVNGDREGAWHTEPESLRCALPHRLWLLRSSVSHHWRFVRFRAAPLAFYHHHA